jgi:hypothetical protein
MLDIWCFFSIVDANYKEKRWTTMCYGKRLPKHRSEWDVGGGMGKDSASWRPCAYVWTTTPTTATQKRKKKTQTNLASDPMNDVPVFIRSFVRVCIDAQTNIAK